MENREYHSNRTLMKGTRIAESSKSICHLPTIYLNILYIQVNVFHKAVMVDGSYGVISSARRRGLVPFQFASQHEIDVKFSKPSQLPFQNPGYEQLHSSVLWLVWALCQALLLPQEPALKVRFKIVLGMQKLSIKNKRKQMPRDTFTCACCSLTREPASSIKSIALSGRKRSLQTKYAVRWW